MTEEQNEPTPPPTNYYVVILHSDGALATEEFEALPDLVARLKALINTDVSVFAFSGTRLQISKPPYRYLLTPEANIALYDVPEDLEPDDTGYLGVDPTYLETPPEIKAPNVRTSSAPANEFFSDEDENTINVFDNILPDPDS
jgi:hypothetical protein